MTPRRALHPLTPRRSVRRIPPQAIAAAALLLSGATGAQTGLYSAGDTEHPRVLMDTELRVGAYRVAGTEPGQADEWGYRADGVLPAARETVAAGGLGDTTFEYHGTAYTVERLAVAAAATGRAALAIVDGDGAALPAAAAVGVELEGAGGRTFLVDWRSRTGADDELGEALALWRASPGAVVAVRVLDLDAPDVWHARLGYGALVDSAVGHGAAGALSPASFSFGGVDHAVTRLAVVAQPGDTRLQLKTLPRLPVADLRLAVPLGGSAPEGLAESFRLTAAHLKRGDPDIDYEWTWSGAGPGALANDAAPVYLTHAPGETSPLTGLFSAALTPAAPAAGGDLVGYRRAGLDLPDAPGETAGAGSLSADTVTFDGVAHTLEALALVRSAGAFAEVWLRAEPPLPRDAGLWLELGHADGTSSAYPLDAAADAGHGTVWRGVGARLAGHGWGEDGGDADADPDARRVRLLRPLAPLVATPSPGIVAEHGGSAAVVLEVGFADGRALSADTAVPVTVTVGDGADGASAPADYAPVQPVAVSIPAASGGVSTTSVTMALADDAVAEGPETVSFRAASAGRRAGAPRGLVIEDDDRPQHEYWRATLPPAPAFEAGDAWFAGYFAPLAEARGAAPSPTVLRCCRGRQTADAKRVVRVVGRAGERFVLGMNGLVRDAAPAPEFAGATLEIGGLAHRLDDAHAIDFAGAPALAWPWRRGSLPDPAEERFGLRLTGPDHPLPTGVAAVSAPGGGTATDRRYAAGETIEIALAFDQPVTVAGAPALSFALGANPRTAVYAYGSGGRTLVFAYTVLAADADDDGIDVGRVADAVTLGAGASIVSAHGGLEPVYGDLDPAPFTDHRVQGSLEKPSAPTLSLRDASVGEGDGKATLTAVLSFAADAAVTADWATADATARAGSDYTAVASGTLTVAVGTRTATIEVAVADDADAEGPETFTVTLSGASVTLADAAATVTIVDDDAADATVGVAAPAGRDGHWFEREIAGADWTLSAATAPTEDLVVNVVVEEAGGDFVPASAEGVRQVTIAAGTTTATLAPVFDDETDEPHGTVTVRVAPGEGYAPAAAAGVATVAVRDDDFRAAPLVFTATPAAATVVEGGSLAVRQVVQTVADGTFTETGDIARVLTGFGDLRMKWGVVTHLGTEAGDIAVAASEAALAAADFETYTAADGGTGLRATKDLAALTATDDDVEEGDERVLVALKRSAGDAALLRPGPHPGAAGFDATLTAGSYYRVAVTVRDQALALVATRAWVAEGGTVRLRATMNPTRAEAFDVTVSLGATERLRIVRGEATLSFAAGAAKSTGEVVVRALRSAGEDGTDEVVATGTPDDDAADVDAASTTLEVRDAASVGGAVLWETELTLGRYTEGATGDGRHRRRRHGHPGMPRGGRRRHGRRRRAATGHDAVRVRGHGQDRRPDGARRGRAGRPHVRVPRRGVHRRAVDARFVVPGGGGARRGVRRQRRPGQPAAGGELTVRRGRRRRDVGATGAGGRGPGRGDAPAPPAARHGPPRRARGGRLVERPRRRHGGDGAADPHGPARVVERRGQGDRTGRAQRVLGGRRQPARAPGPGHLRAGERGRRTGAVHREAALRRAGRGLGRRQPGGRRRTPVRDRTAGAAGHREPAGQPAGLQRVQLPPYLSAPALESPLRSTTCTRFSR